MARNWMVNPRIHCTRHLNGAHVECHIFAGILRKKNKIDGYIRSNCIEIDNLIKYHDILALEMLRRGFDHKTELNELPDLSHLTLEQKCYKIDREKSLEDLLDRCEECRNNYIDLINELTYIFV